jgi:hypothetical protein
VVATGSSASRSLGDRFAETVKVADFGAKGSFKQADTASINSGSNLVTVTGANFASSDVGLIIEIRGAGEANQYIAERQNLRATITEFIGSNQVRISSNSQASVTGKRVYWGYDDSAAIQAAIDYAITKNISMVEFEPKSYWVNTFKANTVVTSGTGANGILEIRNGTVDTQLTIRGNGCRLWGTNTTSPLCGQFVAVNSRFRRLTFDDIRFEWDDQRRGNAFTAQAFGVYPVSSDPIELLSFRKCQFVNCQYAGLVRNFFPGPAFQRDTFGKLEIAEWVDCEFLYPYASCISYNSTDPSLGAYPDAAGQTINLSQWIRTARFVRCFGEGCRDGIIPNDVNGPKDGFNYVCAINTIFDSCTFRHYAIETIISEITGESQLCQANSYTQPAIGSNVTVILNGTTFGTPNFNYISTGDILVAQANAFETGVNNFSGVYEALQSVNSVGMSTSGTTLLLKRLDEKRYFATQSYFRPSQPLDAGDTVTPSVQLTLLNMLTQNAVIVTGCNFVSDPVGRATGINPAYKFQDGNDQPVFRNKGARGVFSNNIVTNFSWLMDLDDGTMNGNEGGTIVSGNIFKSYPKRPPSGTSNANNGTIGILLRQEGSIISNNIFRYATNKNVKYSIFVGVDNATIRNNTFEIDGLDYSDSKTATALDPSTHLGADAVLITCTNHGFENGQEVFIKNSNTVPSIDGVWAVLAATTDTFKVYPRQITQAGTSCTIDLGVNSAITLFNPSSATVGWQNISFKDNYIKNFDFVLKGQSGNSVIIDGPNRVALPQRGLVFNSDQRFQFTQAKLQPTSNGWYRLVYGQTGKSLSPGNSEGTLKIMGLEFAVSTSEQANTASICVLKNPLAPYSGADNKLPISKIRLIRATRRAFVDVYVDQFNHWKDWLGRYLNINAYAHSDTGTVMIEDAKPSLKITAIAADGSNALVTSNNHGLYNGSQIYISDSNSTPSINGLRTVTSATTNTFKITDITVTVAGTEGEMFDQEFDGATEVTEVSLDKTTAMALSRGGIALGQSRIDFGSGVPAIDAPAGSIFIRNDGDASTTLYVRASGAWKPLASYEP